jgi:hypothetical protein
MGYHGSGSGDFALWRGKSIGRVYRLDARRKTTERPQGLSAATINLRQGVPNLGAESGVSGRTRLLPGTLAHALVVLHNALPTGHEASHNG